MARRGRFGRLPRSAPNLASTIVAMVREINAQEDANILQAWEEGGEYKGKPVTDRMLLDHFRMRRDSMSKTDPLWDKWNTALDNYEFAIAESKMTLKYAEHKVGEGQMAAFYRKWANKLPTNSEAYRNLMRSAAQFADAAKARSGGGGGGGSSAEAQQAAYNSAVRNSYDRHERGWDDAQYLMLAAAYRAGILQITDTTDPDDLMDLRGGDEADHQRFLDLFDAIQNDPYYADIKRAMREYGLEGLTYGQFLKLAESKQVGIKARVQIARQFKDASGAEDAQEEMIEFATQRAIIGDTDEFAAYQTMRRTVDEAIAAGGLSPFEVADLLGRYEQALGRLRDTAFSDQTKGFFNNEMEALQGRGTIGPTAFEGVEGGIRTATSADAVGLSGLLALARQQVRLVESGAGFLTVGIAEDGRPAYDVIGRADARLRDPHVGTVVLNAQGAGARGTVPTFVQYQPIYAQAVTLDERTGLPTAQVGPEGGMPVIGQMYTLNGRTYYGIYLGEQGQQMQWFSDNPFVPGARQSPGQDGGLVVQITATPEQVALAAFNPLSVVEARALDADLPYTYRYDTALEAVYDRDPQARAALLRATNRDLAEIADATGGPDAYNELVFLRSTIVTSHNSRVRYLRSMGADIRAEMRDLRGLPSIESDIPLEEFDVAGGELSQADKDRVNTLVGGIRDVLLNGDEYLGRVIGEPEGPPSHIPVGTSGGGGNWWWTQNPEAQPVPSPANQGGTPFQQAPVIRVPDVSADVAELRGLRGVAAPGAFGPANPPPPPPTPRTPAVPRPRRDIADPDDPRNRRIEGPDTIRTPKPPSRRRSPADRAARDYRGGIPVGPG